LQAVKWNRKQILTAVVLVVLVATVAAQAYVLVVVQAKGSTTNTVPKLPVKGNGTITVSGIGHVDLQPDRAITTVGVTSQATTAQTAVEQNANMMSAVIQALNGIGISNNDIQTLYYNIYPQTNYNGGSSTITGYQVTNEIQVTVIASGQSLAQLGAKAGLVIDTVASKGANQIYGVQFTVSASTLLRAQQTALQQASQDALQNAHLIASAIGVTITGLVTLSSVPSYYPVYSFGMTTATPTTIVPPQSLTVTSTVQAVFAIN